MCASISELPSNIITMEEGKGPFFAQPRERKWEDGDGNCRKESRKGGEKERKTKKSKNDASISYLVPSCT